MKIVGIMFNDDDKVYYYDSNDLNLKSNLTVIVDSDSGLQFGRVVSFPSSSQVNTDVDYKKVIRVSTKKDYLQYLANLKDAKSAILKCRELVKENDLSMSIIDASYNFDRTQLLFHFTSDSRVDFRKLARDLGALYRTRIELRQIGIRDKARKIGGVGPCGRKLCCNSFLNEFDSVSINMAKNQALSLNPSKINGVCGRLLCCLKYENDNYSEYKIGMPSVGTVVETDKGKGKIISVDLLKRTYKVYTDKNGIIEVEVDNDSKK